MLKFANWWLFAVFFFAISRVVCGKKLRFFEETVKNTKTDLQNIRIVLFTTVFIFSITAFWNFAKKLGRFCSFERTLFAEHSDWMWLNSEILLFSENRICKQEVGHCDLVLLQTFFFILTIMKIMAPLMLYTKFQPNISRGSGDKDIFIGLVIL